MDDQESLVIDATTAFVKKTLANAEGGHDWFHVERVWKTSKEIAKHEKVNQFVVELAALLHDVADSKFHGGDEDLGPAMAKEFLQSQDVNAEIVEHVVQIIRNMSFKVSNFSKTFHSSEMHVVQDADRLDALGAIGIARTFNYGGFKNRAIYDPAIAPNLKMSKEEYKKSDAPTINHFYEKLLLLKDKMNTKTGLEMAKGRHQFLENFLNQFYLEWEGKA